MTSVAEVKRPEMTALEDASTVIEGAREASIDVSLGGEAAGVGYASMVAALPFMLLSTDPTSTTGMLI